MSMDRLINNAPVHLDLTGTQDRIICVCSGYQVIPFNAPKKLKKKICLEFTINHKHCKKK